MRNGAADLDIRSWGGGAAPARLIPSEPTYADVSERRFAERLRQQLPDDAVIFANQRFTDRAGDREADLIILWPGHGIVVVEVKGGLIHLIDGQWRQPSSRDRRGWLPIDPVEQALKCKYALHDYLFQHPRWSRGNPRLIHMLALPATQLDDDFQMPDAPRWLVMDRTDTPYAAERIVTALRQLGPDPVAPTSDDVRLIIECIAGAAVPQQELLDRLHEREDTYELLSEEQGRILDMLASNSRVEIRGGAGSGKTWLAVEQARRLALAGKRVALLCCSRGIAEYLGRRIGTFARGQRPAYVGTFHSLGIDWGAPPGSDDDPEYWEHRLPQAMASIAARRPFFERFDAIVIDEAQDFPETWWLAVLAALRDPDDGELYVFSDENQRVLARRGRPPVPLTVLDLTENLRNTKQIAGTFSSLAPSVMRARRARHPGSVFPVRSGRGRRPGRRRDRDAATSGLAGQDTRAADDRPSAPGRGRAASRGSGRVLAFVLGGGAALLRTRSGVQGSRTARNCVGGQRVPGRGSGAGAALPRSVPSA